MTNADLEREFFANQDQSTQVFRGVVTAPAAGAAIVTVGGLPAGTYKVVAHARYGAVVDVMDNMDLRIGGTVIAQLPVEPVVNGRATPVELIMSLNGASSIFVRATAIGAAGAVYIAQLFVTKIGDL